MTDQPILGNLLIIALIGGAIFFFFFIQIKPVNTVILPQSTVDILNDRFQGEEFALCLKGQIKDGIANLNEFTEPKLLSNETSGINIKCPINTKAIIHNHQNKVCKLSLQDSYTFGLSKQSTIGVICGTDFL